MTDKRKSGCPLTFELWWCLTCAEPSVEWSDPCATCGEPVQHIPMVAIDALLERIDALTYVETQPSAFDPPVGWVELAAVRDALTGGRDA